MDCYCTVQDVIDRFQEGYLVQTGAMPNPVVLPFNENVIFAAICDACFTIDIMLADRYPIPFTGGPDAAPKMVRQLCATMAGSALGRRWPGQYNADAWRKVWDDAVNILKAIADGFMILPDTPTLPRFIESILKKENQGHYC